MGFVSFYLPFNFRFMVLTTAALLRRSVPFTETRQPVLASRLILVVVVLHELLGSLSL